MNEIDTTNSVWLLQWFNHRIQKNRNVIALFIGDTGSGKSLSSIRLAERVDPSFNVDRIVFTVQEFVSLVNSGLSPGSVIIFDDAGLGINARLWQDMNARVFGMLTQGFRYKQLYRFLGLCGDSPGYSDAFTNKSYSNLSPSGVSLSIFPPHNVL